METGSTTLSISQEYDPIIVLPGRAFKNRIPGAYPDLPTKEKAEWLFKLTYKCYWCGREYTPRSPSLYNEKECPFKKCMKDKKDFEKWLKEKHGESE